MVSVAPDGLRFRKQAKLRENIRRTALRLFLERGYEQTSVADIAAAIDVSPVTVFRYFGTKPEIVLASRQSQVAALPAAIAAQLASVPPLEAARAALFACQPTEEPSDLAAPTETLIAMTPALSAERSLLRGEMSEILTRALLPRFSGPGAELDARVHAIAAAWPAFVARLAWARAGGAEPAASFLAEAYRAVDDAARAEPLDDPLHVKADETIALMRDVRSELRGVRQRKAYRLRTALERAGLTLFTERGYHATTIDDIVARADVSRRTFFRYFSSKDDILLDGVFKRSERLREVVLARPASEGPMTAARHGMWVLLTATYGEDNPVMREFGELIVRPECLPQLMKMRQRWGTVLGEALAARMRLDKDAPAAHAIASTVLWASHAGQDRWLKGDGDSDIGSAVDAAHVALQRALTGFSADCPTAYVPPTARFGRVPELGEHTDRVRAEFGAE